MGKKESKKKKQLDINELAAKIVREATEEKPNSSGNNQPHQKK